MADGALLDKGVVVEVDLVVGNGWKSMAVRGADDCKGEPLGGVDVESNGAGEPKRWRWQTETAILKKVITKRIHELVEGHAGVRLDMLEVHVDEFGGDPSQ